MLSYNLCHPYTHSTRSVSVPAPIFCESLILSSANWINSQNKTDADVSTPKGESGVAYFDVQSSAAHLCSRRLPLSKREFASHRRWYDCFQWWERVQPATVEGCLQASLETSPNVLPLRYRLRIQPGYAPDSSSSYRYEIRDRPPTFLRSRFVRCIEIVKWL